MQNAGLNEAQAGNKFVRININNLRYADDTTLVAESEEELKNLLMKMKEKSGKKNGLKLTTQKTKIMAFGPITSLQIDEETVETITDLIFLVSKITADCSCSHGIKGCLLLGRQAMKNLHSLLKNRYITSLTKVYIVKAMVFLAVVYRYDSWTITKAECCRIDAFEL